MFRRTTVIINGVRNTSTTRFFCSWMALELASLACSNTSNMRFSWTNLSGRFPLLANKANDLLKSGNCPLRARESKFLLSKLNGNSCETCHDIIAQRETSMYYDIITKYFVIFSHLYNAGSTHFNPSRHTMYNLYLYYSLSRISVSFITRTVITSSAWYFIIIYILGSIFFSF